MPDFCLGSASPRRRALLAAQGYRFCVQASDVDEAIAPRPAEAFVRELARRKAEAVFLARGGDLPVLGADTIVAVDGDLLGKPGDRATTAAMLRRLSGREHVVLSGVALLSADGAETVVSTTRVQMAPWSEADIDRYWASGEPADKAGAYAIQGSHSGVVGLPLVETRALLAAAGIRPAPLQQAAA